jgi:hypothetical protein
MDHNVILVSPAVSGNAVDPPPSPLPATGAALSPATATSGGATPNATSPGTGTPTGGPTATTSATATPTSTATPSGGSAGSVSYVGELFLALVLVAVALAGAWLAWRRSKPTANGGLFVGIDNRVSTSKTIALAWTVVVAWMVASEALVAALPQHPPNTFSGLLNSASDLYFVFLGGPFAAAAFAKASVQSKISQGTLTKTTAGTPSVSDLVSDDNGNADLYDLQYVLFNILALFVIIIPFWVHPENGLPDIPAFLAILTGGSALTYIVNKAIAAGGAQIAQVNPSQARIGDVITITGVQLVSTTAGAAWPTVTVGGIGATVVTVSAGPTDTVTATVVDAPAGTTPLTGVVDVVVTPPQASPITSRNAIKIVADQPTITQVQPQPVTKPGLITVTGTLLLTPGTPAGTADPGKSSIGGLTPALTVSGSPWPVSVEGPYSDTELTLRVGDPPAPLGPAATGNATLTLTRGTLQPATTQVSYTLP